MTGPIDEGSVLWKPDVSLLDGLTIAALVVSADGSLAYANPASRRLFGDSPDAGTFETRKAEIDKTLHGGAGGDDAFTSILALVLESGSWGGQLTVAVAGRPTAMSTTWTAVERGGRAVGALLLVEQLPAGGFGGPPSAAVGLQLQRLDRLAEVMNELLTAESVSAAAKVVAEHMAQAAGAVVGSLALLVDEETVAMIAISGASKEVTSRWATWPLSADNPGSESIRTAQPLLLVGREEITRRFPDHEIFGEADRSILCLPLVTGKRTLGVIGLSFPGRWSGDQAELLFLRLLADTCALTLDRLEAQAAAVDREAKLMFLSEMSAQLASDLDYEATLGIVAEAAIPWFADWCTVALVDDGVLRTIAVAHEQPQHEQLVQQLQERYPPGPDDGSYVVLRTGGSTLTPEVTDEMLRAGTRDDEHYQMLARLGLRSALSCALKVNERTFGVITWVSGNDGRRFSPADQVFGEALAQRAGVAIDRAHLHSEVRNTALHLQRAVLPDKLPSLPGWATAVQYLPSGRTDVGGDFYDVVPLPDGRLAVFVGDVMGRGVQAASVMAQMRAAICALTAVDPTPAAVLSGMDRVFDTLRFEPLVTMVYALADPSADRIEVINAGHPAPLLLRSEGSVEEIDPGSTLLLGVGGGHRTTRSTYFSAGDALLLYTDGLVERRGEDLDVGMARLLTAVHDPGLGDSEGWLAHLVDQIRDPTRDDDVAALLLRRTADTPP